VAASFDLALPWVLRHEGGWSDDPSDPGGATNYGITLETARRHGIIGKDALSRITPDQVAEIYRKDYWRFNLVEDQRVATKLMDMAVNMGLMTTVKLAQGVLNDLGASLVVDGVWGPKTRECINAVSPDRMLTLLSTKSADYYRAIVAKRPESVKFLKGWLNRAAEVPE
jgi:type VI secretion system secreted protein VgrG